MVTGTSAACFTGEPVQCGGSGGVNGAVLRGRRLVAIKKLKHLIFGLRNVVIREDPSGGGGGVLDAKAASEFGRLIAYARTQGIEPVVFANHDWVGSDKRSAREVLEPQWGKVLWLTADGSKIPFKPQAGAMQTVLGTLRCEPNEVLYLGSTEDDMRTAVNGEVLFLNAVWHADTTRYGFRFESPREIAKFIDVFCARAAGWAFEVTDGPLRYYSLAPFSTMYSGYDQYSANARSTKEGFGEPEFWGRYLCATLFLTGLYREFDYAAPFPRHTANAWNEPLRESISTFAKCFRKKYIPDLVIRHTSTKSSRQNPDLLTHQDHLSSIRLNRTPTKNADTGAKYVNTPLGTGKTVMVVDDFCTRGRSIEAARVYIERTGSKVILVTWLKTINRDYSRIISANATKFDPYTPNDWQGAKLSTKTYPYHAAQTDDDAYKEVAAKFAAYRSWDWPRGI